MFDASPGVTASRLIHRAASNGASYRLNDDRPTEESVTARAVGGLVRRSPRAAGILRVLARRRVLGALRGRADWPSPAAVRGTFEELGIVFIKFGQVLAVRRDVLPDAYVEELEQLHDRLPPVSFAEIKAPAEQELGGVLADHFASFDEEPLKPA